MLFYNCCTCGHNISLLSSGQHCMSAFLMCDAGLKGTLGNNIWRKIESALLGSPPQLTIQATNYTMTTYSYIFRLKSCVNYSYHKNESDC